MLVTEFKSIFEAPILFLLTVIIHIFSEDDEPVTPFRELIKQYPEKAIKILNYCNR